MTGATRLAARAAQRMGAGVVTLATSEQSLSIYAETLESVIVRECNNAWTWRELLDDAKRNSVLIGPGLGVTLSHAELVLAALDSRKPCVLDADALTNFAHNPDELFSRLHYQCILTPHEGEFEKLFGNSIDMSLPKHDRAVLAAKEANCVVLLKGAETIIATPTGPVITNNNAPPWLAMAGAGDVLAGMILGLIAQKMPVFLAAAAATWLHGKIAGDFGIGLIAEDLVNGIPKALQELMPVY